MLKAIQWLRAAWMRLWLRLIARHRPPQEQTKHEETPPSAETASAPPIAEEAPPQREEAEPHDAPRAPAAKRVRKRHVQPPIPTGVIPEPPRTSEKRQRKRRNSSEPKRERAPSRHTAETLADLLDGIEETFDAVTAPLYRCEINKDLRVGFKRLGPHVMPRAYVERAVREMDDWPTRLEPDPKRIFSSLIFVALPRHHAHEDDPKLDHWSYGSFFYAVKLEHLPLDVAQQTGVHTVYLAGVGWRDFGGKHAVYWSSFHVAIMPDGECVVLPQRLLIPVELPRTAEAPSYTKKIWGVPCAWGQTHWGDRQQERQSCLARWFVYSFTAWESRRDMWTVSVRRDGHRATFCVEPQETSAYFRDRDKTVLTPTGQRKKILHRVVEHERVYERKTVTIKEHLRGLRSFDWRGFACAITAPKFHTWSTFQFDLPTVEEEDRTKNRNYITASEISETLARTEDEQRPVRFRNERAS